MSHAPDFTKAVKRDESSSQQCWWRIFLMCFLSLLHLHIIFPGKESIWHRRNSSQKERGRKKALDSGKRTGNKKCIVLAFYPSNEIWRREEILLKISWNLRAQSKIGKACILLPIYNWFTQCLEAARVQWKNISGTRELAQDCACSYPQPMHNVE